MAEDFSLAEYGEGIVCAVSAQLAAEFGQGFSEKNLRRMVQFAAVFPREKIVVALIRQLSWTHFLRLIPIDDPLKRDFYVEMIRIERWSTRTLEKKLSGMLFERTALSKKPDKLIRAELDALRAEDKLTPDLATSAWRHTGRDSCRVGLRNENSMRRSGTRGAAWPRSRTNSGPCRKPAQPSHDGQGIGV